MPFSPAFSVAQAASAPSAVVFTDDSQGADAAITQRRIYITDYAVNPVVPSGTSTSYVQWALGTNPISVLSLLTTDLAVSVTVQWLDVSNTVLYQSTNTFCLREFNIQNFIYLIQNQALTPNIVQDTNYFANLCQYWICIVGANTMIVDAGDLAGSQNLLDMATNYLNNQRFYF